MPELNPEQFKKKPPRTVQQIAQDLQQIEVRSQSDWHQSGVEQDEDKIDLTRAKLVEEAFPHMLVLEGVSTSYEPLGKFSQDVRKAIPRYREDFKLVGEAIVLLGSGEDPSLLTTQQRKALERSMPLVEMLAKGADATAADLSPSASGAVAEQEDFLRFMRAAVANSSVDDPNIQDTARSETMSERLRFEGNSKSLRKAIPLLQELGRGLGLQMSSPNSELSNG